MSRRSPSPEGVGDLLKQDSFGAFEDEDMAQDMDTNEHDAESMDITLDDQDAKAEAKAEGKELKEGRQPIPIPSFGDDGQASQQSGQSGSGRGKGPARYFIIKSNNHSNIEQSMKFGIWATQKHNEDKLVDAYKSASHVYLIFSVNMSGHFQGYAKMTGLPFRHRMGLWEGGAAVQNSFNVEWIRRYDLPFRETELIRNPLNEDKPIKISRDGQELPLSIGLRVVSLFDEGADRKGVPRPGRPVKDPSIRAGPAIEGAAPLSGGTAGGRFGAGRGMGRGPGRGMQGRGPRPDGGMGMGGRGSMNGRGMGGGGPNGMVMTPMGPMPPAMAMQMGVNPMMGGMGMDGMNPMMGGMGNPMMGMGDMGMGMNGMMGGMMGGGRMGMGGRGGPVPPPKPPGAPPPKHDDDDEGVMALMMKLRGMRGQGRSREEDMLLRALEMSRRGASPRRDRRGYRSRSPSPRRGRSRRRSHSRSRSRSPRRGRDRDRDNLLDMSYDDYLEAYKVLKKTRKEKDSDLGFGGGMSNSAGSGGSNPMMAQMASMMGSASNGMAKRNANPQAAIMGGNMGSSGGAGGVGNLSEEDYVRVWENYSKMTGKPFDAATVRSWYRQHKQYTAMQK